MKKKSALPDKGKMFCGFNNRSEKKELQKKKGKKTASRPYALARASHVWISDSGATRARVNQPLELRLRFGHWPR